MAEQGIMKIDNHNYNNNNNQRLESIEDESFRENEGMTSRSNKRKVGNKQIGNMKNNSNVLMDQPESSMMTSSQNFSRMDLGLKSKMGASSTGKNFKKSFYHFKNIYKIDDFKTRNERQDRHGVSTTSGITQLRASQETDSILKMVQEFKKSVATYLLMQKFNKEGNK